MALGWHPWLETLLAILIAVAIALVIVGVVTAIGMLVGRRVQWSRDLIARVRRAMWVTAVVVAVWIGCAISPLGYELWWPAVSRLFLIATIAAGSWLLASIVSFGFEKLTAQDESGLVGAEGRRRTTQMLVIHRLVLVIIGVIAVGAALFSFPEMRAVGTSLLASAGIVSIIAGLAAQSILGNLIAGVQIAFTDAIRVGDVVVIEGQWGRIGEINLSYVVVYIWDERRLVLPCSYFTTTPIETWTRRSDKILGTVLMDLDWRVPMAEVRAKFEEIIAATDAWDRRASSVAVTDSQGGHVTVRFVMSAKNSADQWALRCTVREQMMTWLQREHPEALPRMRITGEE